MRSDCRLTLSETAQIDVVMESMLPRMTWLRLLRDANGVDAAADSMRRFFREHGDVMTPLEALQVLWRMHCGADKANDDPDLVALLLLLVTVGSLERQLASLLLLCDPRDVADDLKAFASVAVRWCGGGTSTVVWIQLVHVAAIHLSSSGATESAEEMKRLDALREALKMYPVEVSSSQVDEEQGDAMDWNEFTELASGLDHSVLLRTKDGRRSAQLLASVRTQQQGLPRPHGHTGDGLRSANAVETVWESVAIFTKCSGLGFTSPSSTRSEPAKIYDCFEDESALLRHIRHPSSEAIETPPPPVQAVGYVDGPSKTTATTNLGSEQEFIDDQIRALEAIEDSAALRIRVAALLGLQLQRGFSFAASVSTTRSSQWEQAVRKAVNSLTSVDARQNDTRQLLVLAAFHPTAVIENILESALTSSQHHEYFNRLLMECPLLMKWSEVSREKKGLMEKSSIVITALSHAVSRIVHENDPASPMETSATFRFLVRLSSPSLDESPVVVTPDTCIRCIFWPILDALRDSIAPTPTSRLFALIDRFLGHVDSGKSTRLSTSVLLKTTELAITMYAEIAGAAADNAESQHLRGSLLLVTCSLLRAYSTTSEVALALENVRHLSIDLRMECLLASHGVLAQSWVIRTSDDDYAADRLHQISDALLQSIKQLLWWLVWASDCANVDRHLVHLHRLHQHEFIDDNHVTVTGACVIQSQVAELLQSSGSRVFHRIVRAIGAYIVPIAHAPRPTTPNGSSLPIPEEDEGNLRSSCTSQQIMEYVLRCWSLVAFTARQPNDQFITSTLKDVVSLVDQVIESASSDPRALLRCLQATGLLYSWQRTNLQPALGTQTSTLVEITATRALFLLRQLQQIKPAKSALPHDETGIRSTVAAILVSTHLVESESVMSLLRSSS